MSKDIVTPEDIAKLPARFRRHISTLQDTVNRLQADHDRQERTRVILSPYHLDRFLPDDMDIRFVLDASGAKRVDARLVSGPFSTSRLGGDPGCILCLNGSGALKVIPGASNQIYIGLEERI